MFPVINESQSNLDQFTPVKSLTQFKVRSNHRSNLKKINSPRVHKPGQYSVPQISTKELNLDNRSFVCVPDPPNDCQCGADSSYEGTERSAKTKS